MGASACHFCERALRADVQHCPECGQPHILQGKYRITRFLGQGGFGMVYEAVDTRLTRRYAIKVINSPSPAAQEQVEAEANILARHARRFAFMPEIYDIWSEGPRTTLVMEYVDGQTLEELLEQQGAWPAAEVARLLETVLEDLQKLHAVGIVHRDLKPANIKRTAEGRYVLLDFGIAKHQGVTLSGAKALSLYYSPPEQIHSRPTDARSDLYALGATAYQLLTGRPPIPAETRMLAGVALPAPHTLVPDVSPVLEQLLEQLLQLEPAARPADAQTALSALRGRAGPASLAETLQRHVVQTQRAVPMPLQPLDSAALYAADASAGLPRQAGVSAAAVPTARLQATPMSLWGWWVLAHALAWALVWMLGRALLNPLIDGFSMLGGELIRGAVLVALVAVGQALVLRPVVPAPGLWVLASMLGGALGGPLGSLLAQQVGLTVGATATWGLVGVAQSLLLQRYVQSAGSWMLINAIAGGLTGTLTGTRFGGLIVGETFGLANVVVGAIYGALTGLILIWLLRRQVA